MLESFNTGKFEYKRLTEAEQKQRGILGRLKGVIADTKNATRNGRKYSSSLWENVFNNDIMKEKIANRCLFGELGHPVDREETDMEKIAICLAEQPKLGDDGKIYGVFDILSTPNGRILKSLCDYGCTIGVSSRGSGDLYTDDNGDEAVDPETYNCEAWDAVLIPAVKEARMEYVTESLNKTRYNKSLRSVLQESLAKANEDERKVMNEALDSLGINLEESTEDRYAEFNPEDAELHKNTDWKARNYTDLPVPEDSFDHEVTFYRNGQEPEKKTVKVIKYLRSNPIYPPYYAPEEKPFDDSALGPMYDGKFYNMYDIHDRYEDQETYDHLSESDKDERLISKLRDSQELEEDALDDAGVSKAPAKEYAEKMPDTKFTCAGHEVLGKDLLDYFDPDEYLSVTSDNVIIDRKVNEECNSESCTDKDAEEVVDDKSSELVAELQEALLKIKSLEDDNLSLQERLSVCNAKENGLQEELDRYKKATVNLSETAKRAKSLDQEKAQLTESLDKQTAIISKHKARVNTLLNTKKELTEQLKEAKALNTDMESKLSELNESLEDMTKQLANSKESLAKYKKSYSALKESYIQAKAESYGLSKDEVKANLKESYSLKDVDDVCGQLHKNKNRLSKLPFVIDESTNITFKKSDNEYIMNESLKANSDDYVSDSLLHLANLR